MTQHHILSLIAADKPLTNTHIGRAEAFLDFNEIGQRGKATWLIEERVAEIPVPTGMGIDSMKALRALFQQDRIDVLCTPALNRRKKLLLADMDSTIVTSETLDELAAFAGIKDKVAAITARAMNGEIDFPHALMERVALLENLPLSALKETLDQTAFSQGAKEMVAGLKRAGVFCVLVSGGFTFFTEAIAEKAGFDEHHGNVLHHDGRVLSGRVGLPILDKDSKLAFLKAYAAKLEISLEDTIAIGDGANDLPMLQHAGLGIAYRPKPVLEAQMLNVLRFSDLRSVLYAQGFHEAEGVN